MIRLCIVCHYQSFFLIQFILVSNYWPEFCCAKKNLSCFNDSGTLSPWKTVCSPKAIETSSSGVTTPGAVSSSVPQQWAAVITQRSLNNLMNLNSATKKILPQDSPTTNKSSVLSMLFSVKNWNYIYLGIHAQVEILGHRKKIFWIFEDTFIWEK